MQSTTFIYALADPLTFAVRYVGKSNNPDKRYIDHVNEARKRQLLTYKNNWIYSLQKSNLKPILMILEEVEISKWQEKEKMYISIHRDAGANLTNGTDGGDGVTAIGELNGFFGKKHSEESKKKMSKKQKLREDKPFKDKSHSEESKQKMKEAHLTRDEEWRVKQRDSHLGRKDSEITFENKSKAQSGKANGNAKLWTLKSPDGNIIQIKSLKTWCVENGITVEKIHSNTKRQVTNDWIIITNP